MTDRCNPGDAAGDRGGAVAGAAPGPDVQEQAREVVIVQQADEPSRDDEVSEFDRLEQARDVLPTQGMHVPTSDDEVSEFDRLEQAREVVLDEDLEGYGG